MTSNCTREDLFCQSFQGIGYGLRRDCQNRGCVFNRYFNQRPDRRA